MSNDGLQDEEDQCTESSGGSSWDRSMIGERAHLFQMSPFFCPFENTYEDPPWDWEKILPLTFWQRSRKYEYDEKEENSCKKIYHMEPVRMMTGNPQASRGNLI